MWSRMLMRLFVVVAATVSATGYFWMLFAPPPGLQATRDGVPYFSPPVLHPISGEAIPLEKLVRHYKGEK